MEELKKEEKDKDPIEETLMALKSPSQRENRPLGNLFSQVLSNEKFLPALVFALLAKDDKKVESKHLDHKLKEALPKAENALGMVAALNEYATHKSQTVTSQETKMEKVPYELLEIMEVIRPYVHGKGREKIEKTLAIQHSVDRIKKNQDGEGKMIQNVESIMDILDALQIEKGQKIRSMLSKAKDIISILKK